MTKKKAFWGDARFFIGLALVAVSVAGVWGVVAGARQTTPVLVASDTIVPGQAIVSADVAVVEVSLGSLDGTYLRPGDELDGMVAQRTIGAGELLPVDATGRSSDATTIVVDSAAGVPSSVAVGSTVELWVTPVTEEGFDAPRVLVADATVGAITRGEAMISATEASVELIVRRTAVADVLAAIASGAALSVVPLGATG